MCFLLTIRRSRQNLGKDTMKIINGNIYLSKGKSKYLNFIEYNRVYYYIENLDKRFPKSRGGNSSVFKLIDPNTETEFAIKFCKYANGKYIKENNRFEREINALKYAQDAKSGNIIQIIFHGQKEIGANVYRYYVMEKADYDLKSFLNDNEVANSQKILLCYEIIRGIKELHALNIYHRDIKPDNIFFTGTGTWKIGDLGLMAYRDEDLRKEEFREKIGPVGWLSPEVMSKVLCEGSKFERSNDCSINFKSDIFQLGKVFWFIFKHNIPIGQVRYSDFRVADKSIFFLISQMIQYKKSRRNNLNFYYDKFLKLAS